MTRPAFAAASRAPCGIVRRELGCFQQALLTLVHLRKNETFARLGAGFGMSRATARRYADEAGRAGLLGAKQHIAAAAGQARRRHSRHRRNVVCETSREFS
ncbi:response regulator of citrate/malate metabolism [Streptomyces fulvorobeus]|uniref:Response regulator of citrate/malate metabolism n=1 Tax=Streptomyces fulvorobeus TaxID=284028 RepID=A0A7Y9KZ39_9ACTN|nr:response regulator of citrate/malate metabolism [Streptomyces fulvorobeus]